MCRVYCYGTCYPQVNIVLCVEPRRASTLSGIRALYPGLELLWANIRSLKNKNMFIYLTVGKL